jgi:MoxR-like ATPase
MAKEKETKSGDKAPLSHLKSPWIDVIDKSSKQIMEELEDDYYILCETGYQKPVFIYGAPGIGKTEIIQQVCDKLGISMNPVELRYAHPVDLIGVPKVVEEVLAPGVISPYGAGVTRSNPPLFWPRSNWPNGIIPEGKTEEDGPGGIIFFDEFNRADEYVMDALMQFVQTRKLAGTNYKLPSKWMVIAAGNRPQDDRPDKIKDMGSAMVDRFTIINYVPTPEDFVKHIQNYEKPIIYNKRLGEIVLPEVISFVSHLPEWFHGDYTEGPDLLGNFTPRGWVDACKKLEGVLSQKAKRNKGKRTISENEVSDIFTAAVGYKASNAFMSFYNLVKRTPIDEINSVFDNPEKAPLPKKEKGIYVPNLMWAWVAAIVSHAEKIWPITPEKWANCIKYMVRMESAEYTSAFIHMMHSHIEELRKDRKFYSSLMIWQEHYGRQIED